MAGLRPGILPSIPPAVLWRFGPMPNPFTAPRPPAEHQPYAADGDPTVRRRTPEQIREMMDRRVGRWFGKAFNLVPADSTRDDMIASVFGQQGWVPQARVADVSDRWPMHGWLLAHSEHGYIVYADKSRDGDLGRDYVARGGGPWGGCTKLVWGGDLTELITGIGWGRVAYPHVRSAQKLIAHAYRTAHPEEQATVAFLLGLSGYDLAALLSTTDADHLSVLPA